MKWSKYQEHMTDPRLGLCLNWHVSAWSSGDALRDYVERIVKYIAVRPWENLDLQSGDSGDGVTFVTYYVHYHITNDDQRGHYIRTTHDMDGEESEEEATPTIASIYESIKWWHCSYWAKQPGEHKIVIDAVVQQSEAIMALAEGKLSSGALAKGGKVTGKLAYQVPKDDAGLKLLYQNYSFFNNKTITFSLQ